MNSVVPLVRRVPAAVLTGLALGALFSYLWLWTFHPDHPSVGPIELLGKVSKFEVALAVVFGLAVFTVTVWRILHGSRVRDEVNRAAEVLEDDGD
jgi:hypothetical protein